MPECCALENLTTDCAERTVRSSFREMIVVFRRCHSCLTPQARSDLERHWARGGRQVEAEVGMKVRIHHVRLCCCRKSVSSITLKRVIEDYGVDFPVA